MFVSSAVMATLYFGGYNYPGMDWVNSVFGTTWGPLVGVLVIFIKIFAFHFLLYGGYVGPFCVSDMIN